MALDDIKLNSKLLASLYKNFLIGGENEPFVENFSKKEGTASSAGVEIPHLGGGMKPVLIFINEPGEKHLNTADLEFLSKILGACALTLDDVRIINIQNTAGIHLDDLQQFSPASILFFGVEAKEIGVPMQFPQYRFMEHAGIKLITAPALAALQTDAEGKKQLWSALKSHFSAA